ncbi:hypothetical protein CEP52_001009 [Fusarium oligoseptatum]|uniref:Heterokaryon incompatibility domain-containing protein n=1 Tax=Fusarium oligoseptatum TaxID=2604345 RepID=A0A428UL77_9HYPO|nr:hypothetical protein CEP52_001009 [Fusarium oligoseptatum]
MSPCKSCRDFAADDARGTLERVYKAAENGCICCDAVQQAVRKLLPEASSPEHKYILWTMERRERTDMLHPADSTQWEMSLRIEKQPFIIEHDILIHAVPEQPSPWKKVPLLDDIPTSTDSEESCAFALDALKECLDNHSLCENATDGFLPTRLVEVQEASVRVVQTHDLDPAQTKYLALSHCWGPPETITAQLNDETYEEYTKEIPAAVLPKTFKDAVAITRKLGYKYIWIDSLCIIQHNVECWIKEGSQMCQIYENSLLTLAAASSSSGQGGLFYNSPKIEMTGTIPESGQEYRLFARFNFNHRFFNYPLMNRAWVMQERLLSPRTLYFTSQELVWECRTRNICQCSPILGGFQAQVSGFPNNSKLQPVEAHLDTSALVSKWYEVVEIYTHLKLTHPGDKLMAIDGIAQYMAPMRESQHFAGLWREYPSGAPQHGLGPVWKPRSCGILKKHQELPKLTSKSRSGPNTGKGYNLGLNLAKTLRSFFVVSLLKTTVAEADIVVNTSPCLYQDCAEWVPSDGHTQDDEPLYCLRLLEAKDLLCSLVLRKSESQGQTVYQRHGLLLFQADPKTENEVWNTRDRPRSRWDRVKPKVGFPSWWEGGDLTSVTII